MKPTPATPASAPADASGSLLERSITGVLWSALGTGLRVALQLFAQIALARLLGPEPFGLFAVALVVVAFSGFFAEVGLAYGLIQKNNLNELDIRFAFTWQLLLGATIMALLIAGADAAAGALDDARAAPVLRWLALGILINALAATPMMLLRRRLDFKWLQLSNAAAYAIGYLGIGLPLALAGWQAGALVAAYLSHSALSLLLAFVRAPHSLRPLLWHQGAKSSLHFGLTAFGTNLVNWAMTGVDRLIIGRAYSVLAAGLYAQMHAFMSSPAMTLLSTVQQVLYSAGATVQDEPARLRRALAVMLALVALLVAPPFAAIAVVSDSVVLGLYGPRWADGATLLTPLALAMPMMVATGLVTPMLWNSGRIGMEMRIQLPISLIWVGLCLWLARHAPLPAIGWGLAGIFTLRALLMGIATMRALALPARQALLALRAGLIVVTPLCAAGVWLADLAARAISSSAALWLTADVLAGALLLPLAIRLAAGWITPELRGLLGTALGRLPPRLAGWLVPALLGR